MKTPELKLAGAMIGAVQHNRKTGMWRACVTFEPSDYPPYHGQPRATEAEAHADLRTCLEELQEALDKRGVSHALHPLAPGSDQTN